MGFSGKTVYVDVCVCVCVNVYGMMVYVRTCGDVFAQTYMVSITLHTRNTWEHTGKKGGIGK